MREEECIFNLERRKMANAKLQKRTCEFSLFFFSLSLLESEGVCKREREREEEEEEVDINCGGRGKFEWSDSPGKVRMNN